MKSINNNPENRFVVSAIVSPSFIRANHIEPDSIFEMHKSEDNTEIKIFLNVNDYKLAETIHFLANNNKDKSVIEVCLIADYTDNQWNKVGQKRQNEIYNFMLDVDFGKIKNLDVQRWSIF